MAHSSAYVRVNAIPVHELGVTDFKFCDSLQQVGNGKFELFKFPCSLFG